MRHLTEEAIHHPAHQPRFPNDFLEGIKEGADLQSGSSWQRAMRSRQEGGGSWRREQAGCRLRRTAEHRTSPAAHLQNLSGSTRSTTHDDDESGV